MFGPFIGIFAIRLGASNTIVALLSSLPALVAAFTALPGTIAAKRFSEGKQTVAAFYGISRLFYLLTAAVPLFNHDLRPWALVMVVGLMNLPGTIATISWQSMMADLIPLTERGRAFGLRNRLMTLAGFGPTLAVGWLLDRMPFPFGYQVVFAFAFLVSITEILFLLRLRDNPTCTYSEGENKEVWSSAINSLKLAFGDGPFRSFTLRSLAFQLTWQMGWPLFTIYQVRYLGADNTWTGLFSVSSSLTSFMSYQWWGRLGDRVGTARGLFIATMGMALTPAFYALATNLWYIVLLNLSVGFFSAGTVLLLFNGLLAVAPEENRSSYLAVNTTLVSASAAIAPLLGKWIADIIGVRWALVAVALLRLGGCYLLKGIDKSRSAPIGKRVSRSANT